MAGPLPNLHVANAALLILLSYYLLKSIFHLCYPRPKYVGRLGPFSPGSYILVVSLPRAFPSMVVLNPPPLSSLPANPKVPPLFSCPATGL